jgi:hypothetical protein
VHKLKGLIPLLALLVLACDDPWGPQYWSPTPYPVDLHSASRPDYVGLVSAVDLVSEPVRGIAIEAPGATGNWDFVLAEQAGALVLMPAVAFTGIQSRARIGVIEGRDFLEIDEAPRDTTAYTAGPVPLREGVVYVIRSRIASCGFTNGHRYAKMVASNIDRARGTATLAIVRNPYCDDRALVPPTD